jgi:hypothetical protein
MLLLIKWINKVNVPCNYVTLQPDYRRTLRQHKSRNKTWPAVVNPKALQLPSAINQWQETLFSFILTNIKGVRRAVHVRWVPCHHGMARPEVAGGGGALQLWREAANILNKQSRTADKGWSSSLGVGRGASNYSP